MWLPTTAEAVAAFQQAQRAGVDNDTAGLLSEQDRNRAAARWAHGVF